MNQPLHVVSNHLSLNHTSNLVFTLSIQVVPHPIYLLSQTLLSFLQIIPTITTLNKLLRLNLVKLRRSLQERLLEIILIHRLTQVHKHLSHIPHQPPVNNLASPLLVNKIKKRVEKPRVYLRRMHYIIPPQTKPHGMNMRLLSALDVSPIHIHEDITYHLQRLVVLVPLLVELLEKCSSLSRLDEPRLLLEMTSHGGDEPRVELLAELVENHVVRVSGEPKIQNQSKSTIRNAER